MIGFDQGSVRLSSPKRGGLITPSGYVGSSFIIVVRMPGTTLAHPDSNVYGRRSDASFCLICMVAVANHMSPCAVWSFGQMYSPTPNGRVLLAVTDSV